MLRTIATVIIRAFTRAVRKLDQATKDHRMTGGVETVVENASRRALSIVVLTTAGIALSFPGLHPQVAAETSKELSQLAVLLWATPLTNPDEGAPDDA